MVTFALVPFRLSDNPRERERLHVYVCIRGDATPRKKIPREGNADRECVSAVSLITDNG